MLLKEAGLFDGSAGLQYALRGKDGLGAQGEVFFGDTALFELNPVVLDVHLPNGSWQLAAIPVGGWGAVSPRLSLFRIGGALLAIMAAGLAFFATLSRTRLREREQALRGSEKRYRVLYEDNPAMYFTVGREGTVLSVNRFGAEQLGYGVDELLGQSVLNIFHPDDKDAVLRQLNECFENPEQLFRWEFRKVHKDDGVIWVREAARAVRATDGKALALIVCEDITELKRTEESLRRAHDELELRVEERTALLSSTVAVLESQMAERKRAEEALRDRETALRESQKDLQDLAGKLLTAQEEERRRLARELHDDLTQRLAVLAIEAGRLEQQLHGAPHPVLERLRHMKEQIVKLSADVHGISRQLHPSILDDLGLVSAMESECANLTQREGIAVKYESHNVPTTLPRDVALCLYRIAQEALRNIAKHAKTTEAYVALVGTDDAIRLSVWDDGVGFDPAQIHKKPGLGLASMEERVRLIRGRLSIQSDPGKGTSIEVWVPVAGGDTT
jgi:PAS domain S-box-containing protein